MRAHDQASDHGLEVVCPTCLETSEVPFALVFECRRLLAEGCNGAWSDYECPAQYYARLSVPAADEPVAGEPPDHALERWETDGGAVAPPGERGGAGVSGGAAA